MQLVRSLLDQAPAAGLTVMRAWATTVDDNYALQPSPGVYNEAVFRGLDYTLDQASQRNIKVGPLTQVQKADVHRIELGCFQLGAQLQGPAPCHFMVGG